MPSSSVCVTMISPSQTPPRSFPWPRVLLTVSLALLVGCAERPDTGTLVGSVLLSDQSDHEAIEVYIPGTTFRAVTDSQGRYRFSAIPSGEYELVIDKESYHSWRETIAIVAGELTSSDTVILDPWVDPVGAIVGHLRLEGYERHEGATVLLIGLSKSTVSDATGTFELLDIPPGVYELAAIKDGFLSARRAGITVTENETTTLDKLLLEDPFYEEPIAVEDILPATGAGQISGRAFLQGSLDYSGTWVEVADYPHLATSTRSNGAFVLERMPIGTFDIVFRHEGYEEAVATGIQSTTAIRMLPMIMIHLRPLETVARLGRIEGRIMLEGADDHAGTFLSLRGQEFAIETDELGDFELSGVRAGEYILSAEHDGYTMARVFISIKAGGITPRVDLTLQIETEDEGEAWGSVEGQAFLDNADDHSGILVAVQGTTLMTLTEPDGSYAFPDVPAGPTVLLFQKADYGSASLETDVPGDETVENAAVVLESQMERPFVTETIPGHGGGDVPVVDGVLDVLATFSEPMAGPSVKQAVEITPPVNFRAYFDRETDLSNINQLHLEFYRDGPDGVRFKTTYRVRIDSSAASMRGVEMEEPYTFEFRTAGPLIVRSLPEDGARGFMVFDRERMWFETNAAVDPRSAERAIKIRPRPDSNPEIYVLGGQSGSRVQIETTLKDDARYRITIGRELRTVNGERFSNVPYTIGFSTAEIVGDETPRERRRSRRSSRKRPR